MDSLEDREPEICEFQIVIDTREILPWHFTGLDADKSGNPLIVRTITDRHLDTGDYTIAGLESELCIERKSLSDWVGSIGAGHEREERKAARMTTFKYAAYIIESDWDGMIRGWPKNSQIKPGVALGTIASWSMRYGIHFWLLPSRRDAELWCFKLMSTALWRQQKQRVRRKKLPRPSLGGFLNPNHQICQPRTE